MYVNKSEFRTRTSKCLSYLVTEYFGTGISWELRDIKLNDFTEYPKSQESLSKLMVNLTLQANCLRVKNKLHQICKILNLVSSVKWEPLF